MHKAMFWSTGLEVFVPRTAHVGARASSSVVLERYERYTESLAVFCFVFFVGRLGRMVVGASVRGRSVDGMIVSRIDTTSHI